MHRTSWGRIGSWLPFLLIFITTSSAIAFFSNACLPMQGYEIYFMFPEDATVGSVIGRVKFNNWNEIKKVHAEKSSYVRYDASSENITLLKRLDADKNSNKITLRIYCEAKKPNTRNVTITVNIIPTNVNDNPPRFSKSLYLKNLSEDQELGSTIDCGIQASDADRGDNLRFSILPRKDYEYFSINLPGRPLITLNKKLDYESKRHLSIDIMVQDQPDSVGQPKLNDTATVNFTITDADDQNPVFTRNKYIAIVSHNEKLGTPLAIEPTIEAHDPDYTFNETIKLSFDDIHSPFRIDPYNGTVFIKKHLEVGSRTYVIRGTQTNNEERFSVALLQVDVLALNDTSLVFSKSVYEATVVENAPVGTNLLTLSVIYTSKAPLVFGFKNKTDMFRIDESGNIRLMKPLDYEEAPFHTLVAFVRNSAKAPAWKITGDMEVYTIVNISVVDLNDNNPLVTNKDLQIEAMRNGSRIIGRLRVYDPDSDTKLTYQLLFFKQYFNVTDKGEIKIITDPSKLTKSSYQLMIMVDDGGKPPRRTLVNVTVNFPALVVAGPSSGSGLSQSDTLLIVLGVFLAIFVILAVFLSIYIARRCKRTEQDSSSTKWFFRSLYSTDNLDKAKADLAKGDPKGKGFKQKMSHSQGNTNMTLADELDTVSGSNGCGGGGTSVQESPFVDNNVYEVQPSDGYKRFKGGSSMESLYSNNEGSSLERDTPIHSTNVPNIYDNCLIDERPEITVYF